MFYSLQEKISQAFPFEGEGTGVGDGGWKALQMQLLRAEQRAEELSDIREDVVKELKGLEDANAKAGGGVIRRRKKKKPNPK